MFATITPLTPDTSRTRPAASASTRPQRRLPAAQSLDEAYQMRLLAQVARWDDQAAFEDLYAQHRTAVIRVALHICRDAGTAEDIAQQTFTAMWVRAERLVAKAVRLRPWLTTVARNAAIDHLRAKRPDYTSVEQTAQIASNAPSPEDVALAAESKTELAAALATLSADQRTAIELVYIAGMTYQSAADATGEPVGTVKSRVRLAIRHLRGRLEHCSR